MTVPPSNQGGTVRASWHPPSALTCVQVNVGGGTANGGTVADIKGEAVKTLQYLLQAHGATAVATDGKFTAAVGQAVVAFQKTQGLTADGIVGPKTWQPLIVGS